MGRGRQKAKHTKVARELKYSSPDMDLSQLQRELTNPAENEDSYSSDETDEESRD
jgi:hypothetical protein